MYYHANVAWYIRIAARMDNFHFIDIKPTIDRKETASIKDAIFKRAREKANSLTQEKNEGYTSQVQNDVMDVARESFQATSKNPFNQFLENVGLQNRITDAVDEVQASQVSQPTAEQAVKQTPEIPERQVKHNIESVSNNNYVKGVQDEVMASAGKKYRLETNLTMTLNFLNTQAAIQMAKDAHSKINFYT